MNNKIKTNILSIDKLLFSLDLSIPEYQRPYKWGVKNVNQLIDDILLHSDKTAYRLGTVVLHKDETNLNIVDGQQRLLTLSLIAYELLQRDSIKHLTTLDFNQLSIANLDINNTISKQNLKRNQLHIKSRINEFSRDEILFFFQKCEFVYIELTEISEAFQFFDSQNTRGKDLAPHDLLKAFHLREMSDNTEKECLECVAQWEEVSDDLHHIFENYLFRVRQWSKGRSGLNFSKNKIEIFKGITIEASTDYNFVKPYRINHFFTENHNNDFVRNIDKNIISYPFQIDQVIINGKRFFEYVHYYAKYIKYIENAFCDDEKKVQNSILKDFDIESKFSNKIVKTLKTYGGKNRSGDMYVKNLLDCGLLYYIDKFGSKKLDEALVKFFLWAYKLRLEQQAVQLVTVDNYAKEFSSIFRAIREAVNPNEILHRSIKPTIFVGKEKAVKNIEPLLNIFKELNALQV